MKFLKYILVPIILIGLLFISCDKDDNAVIRDVQGHWVYLSTKTEILVTDPLLKQNIESYISNKYKEGNISYEFNTDKTYQYYKSYQDPMKGVYRLIDKNTFILDDSRGVRSVLKDDSVILVISDLKSEIAKELNIDESKIIKVTAVDTFERGLSVQ